MNAGKAARVASIPPSQSPRKQAYEKFVENIYRLYQLCHEKDILLGVETMYPTATTSDIENLLDNPLELEQFCLDIPQVKIVLDLAHMNIWRHCNLSSKLQWLNLPSERVLEIHLSDNDGRHDIHSRITSETWWLPYISDFPTGVACVIESRLNRLPVSVISEEYQSIKALISPMANI